ncbi:EamA family transporter [Nocardioides koreensis]
MLAAAVAYGVSTSVSVRRRRATRNLFAGSLLPGVAYVVGDLGLARTSASSGSLLLTVEPLLTVVLALVFLRERMPRAAVVALMLGLGGSLIVAPVHSRQWLGLRPPAR